MSKIPAGDGTHSTARSNTRLTPLKPRQCAPVKSKAKRGANPR